jgi:predicted RNase H-like HicB family nuclease
MTNIEITFDKETWYYDAILVDKWISTQWKTLDEVIKNIQEAFSLSREKAFSLDKFNISFNESKHVNI